MRIESEEVLKQHRIAATLDERSWKAEAEVEEQHHRTTSEGRQADELMVWAAQAVQTKIGILKKPMPGARIRMIVVTKLTAPMIEEMPDRATARSRETDR